MDSQEWTKKLDEAIAAYAAAHDQDSRDRAVAAAHALGMSEADLIRYGKKRKVS